MADILSRKVLQHETVALKGILEEERDEWFTLDPSPTSAGPVFRMHRSSIKEVFDTEEKISVHGHEEAIKQIHVKRDAIIIRMEFVEAASCCRREVCSVCQERGQFISDEKYACNDDPLLVYGYDATGNLQIIHRIYRESFTPVIYVKGRSVDWKCGGQWETWSLPNGTRYLSIYRGPRGNGVVSYYR